MEPQAPIEAALLDFDGTLVDLPVDWDEVRRQLAQLFQPYQLGSKMRPLVPALERALLSLKERGVSPQARGQLRRKANALLTGAELAAAPGARPLEGSARFLTALRSWGWKIGVQTTNSVQAVAAVWDRLGLPLVDAVVGRESARRLKPHPDGVQAQLRRWGLRGPQVVVIGDSDYDIEVGRAIGARTAWVRGGHFQFGGAEPDWVASSLDELLGLLSASRLSRRRSPCATP